MSPVRHLFDTVTKHYMTDSKDRRATDHKDRRHSPRQDFETTIQYRMPDMPTFGEGQLHNFSKTGVLITLPRKLNIDSDILLIVPTQDQDNPTVHLSCKIARIAGSDQDNQYTYGCKIEMIHDAHSIAPMH